MSVRMYELYDIRAVVYAVSFPFTTLVIPIDVSSDLNECSHVCFVDDRIWRRSTEELMQQKELNHTKLQAHPSNLRDEVNHQQDCISRRQSTEPQHTAAE